VVISVVVGGGVVMVGGEWLWSWLGVSGCGRQR
jgi:hypothetical protein